MTKFHQLDVRDCKKNLLILPEYICKWYYIVLTIIFADNKWMCYKQFKTDSIKEAITNYM